MGQLGFFDLNRRYESLDEKNDPLVAIAGAPRDRATKSWRILQFQTEKPHEREAIAKLVFRLIVGEIVERLQHQSLEDHDFIPRLASRQTLARRIARAKLALDQRRLQPRRHKICGIFAPDLPKFVLSIRLCAKPTSAIPCCAVWRRSIWVVMEVPLGKRPQPHELNVVRFKKAEIAGLNVHD